jgi:ribose transport system substrate-binding protein
VAVDTAIDHPWISCLVQTDNEKAAKLAGEYIVASGRAAKVLINGGTVCHQTGDARRDGVQNAVEGAGGTVIFRACDWLPDKAYETTLNELTAHPDITAIFSACDPMAMSVISAVRQKGREGSVLIVGFDGDQPNLQAIAAGKQDADIKQDSVKMGGESVARLVDVIHGKPVPAFIPIDGQLITGENVAEYLQ